MDADEVFGIEYGVLILRVGNGCVRNAVEGRKAKGAWGEGTWPAVSTISVA